MAKKSFPIFQILILIAIFALGLFAVYRYRDLNDRFVKQNQKIDSAESNLDKFKKDVWQKEASAEIARKEADAQAQIEAQKAINMEIGRRNILNSKNGEYERFFSEYDVSLADKVADFYDPKWGISFSLPYREIWGYDNDPEVSYPPLFNRGEDGIDLVPRDPGQYESLFSLRVSPALSDEVSAPTPWDVEKPKIIDINGLKVVVKHEMDYPCGAPIMVVLGRKFDYTFGGVCTFNPPSENIYKYLETIIKTVKFDPGF